MLTAHLPSGYVVGRLMPRNGRGVMAAALAGSVLPDLDMIWFHFVDAGKFHHHVYWPHSPWVWAGIALVVLPVLTWQGWLAAGLAFFAALLLHMVLDTVAGGIAWAAPFSDHLYAFVTVPPDHSHWIISFLLHWTFGLELVIWALAAVLWWRGRAI